MPTLTDLSAQMYTVYLSDDNISFCYSSYSLRILIKLIYMPRCPDLISHTVVKEAPSSMKMHKLVA